METADLTPGVVDIGDQVALGNLLMVQVVDDLCSTDGSPPGKSHRLGQLSLKTAPDGRVCSGAPAQSPGLILLDFGQIAEILDQALAV